ncbi:DUF3667 domain-containing protein [Flavobacterium hungaricum]|uniref:DUF3667 domain-containing protein n=1 Tax=Flavobacterium hungaricum TaxID=2082725 RepID=A0ABR9THG8_9FLAO|nr:DUF3667 domain-containing protein [Flavobacterium hungaricum]MBE8724785.1 DUF3667 domain-containing protein [Flavobacterium hungaricum]
MEIICKNCQHSFHGNFCNNCGQTAETHKINWHFLWHDIQHSLLHFDAGIPYSIKQLFTRPGHSIREFIEGKRVNHFKPLSLVMVLGALYGFLWHYFNINLFVNTNDDNIDWGKFNEWASTHFAWVTIATIPLFTLGTAVCFRKQGYNFVEYFVLNTFKASQKLFLSILLFPLLYYFYGTSKISTVINSIYLFDIVLIFWTNIQFFNKIPKAKVFWLSVLSHIIFLTSFIFIVTLIIYLKGGGK